MDALLGVSKIVYPASASQQRTDAPKRDVELIKGGSKEATELAKHEE